MNPGTPTSRWVDSGHAGNALTVGTLNVWGRWADWPRRRASLLEAWPRPDPDVVMLQEVTRDAHGDQTEEIADMLGYGQFVAIDAHDTHDGREGIAILSRRPLSDVHDELLPESDPPRRALIARVDIDGVAVTLLCGHTVAVPEHRRLDQVHALLARSEKPLIIGADLNETPATIAPLVRATGFVDALGDDRSPTWPMCRVTFGEAWHSQLGRAPHFSLERRRLDYLLARGLDVRHATVSELEASPGRYASDHALVTAAFAVPGPCRSTAERPSALPT